MNEKMNRGHFLEKGLERVESWLKTPSHKDPDTQRKAEIIHNLSALAMLMGFATLSITPFIFTNPTRDVSVTLVIIALILLVRVLNHRGRTEVAANLFVISVWLFDTGMILFSGGFQSQFLAAYIAVTVMGGLILGEMYAFYLAGTSIVSLLIFYFVDLQGLTPDALIVFTPIAVIMINVVNLFLAATVLIMAIIKYDEFFQGLVKNERALENTNQELQREILAREEAETHLRLSENRLKSALMESPYPTMLHAEDGEILLVNTAWITNSGYSQGELPRFDDWLDHMFRQGSSRVTEIINMLLAGQTAGNEALLDIFKKNGQKLRWYLRWTKLPNLPDGRELILTIATDMTGLMTMESALREREETLSAFTLVTNDGLWNWDLRTDQVVYDPRYYTMAGYEVNEFPHQLEEFRKRVHPDDVEKVFSQADKHLNGEIDRFNVEFRFLKKDGSWIWIMGRGKITEQDENGNPIRFIGTHTDISAQKKIEEKLSEYQLQLQDVVEDRTQELNQRIVEAERLNAALTNILDDYQIANQRLSFLGENLTIANQELESLTYSLSTDLLNPIQAIKDTTDHLIKNNPKNKKLLGEIEAIRQNAALVNQQINDLLQISQLSQQELKLEEIDTGKLIKKVLKTFDKEIKRNKIKTVIKDLPPSFADPGLLELVFENLISNAIKFSAGEEAPQIVIGYQPDQASERVIYYIQDNGIGFPLENENYVFGTFKKLGNQEKQQGTGIGLTLAKLIVNKHNGKIWAESEEGRGATFYFDLARPESE